MVLSRNVVGEKTHAAIVYLFRCVPPRVCSAALVSSAIHCETGIMASSPVYYGQELRFIVDGVRSNLSLFLVRSVRRLLWIL